MDAAGSERDGYLRSRGGVRGPWSAAIDALFADCDRPGQPGVNLAVVQHGRVVHRRGYGVANVEDDVPFTPGTVLHLGSTTKHMTAACVLILEDRGALSLVDPIIRWVDGLPDFCSAITVRHLLTMTSGLPDGLNAGLFSGAQAAGLGRITHLDLLRRVKHPMFAPGTGTTYSNSNYLLLSETIERATGSPLAQVMGRELFEPLGMTSTALVSDPTLATPAKARGYGVDAGGAARAQGTMLDLCGDGGVVTTLDDMIRWAGAYADGRLARDFRGRLETEALLPDGGGTSYGLGMGVAEVFGLRKASHGGGMPGYLADFAYLPEADLAVVWLSNRMDPLLFDRTDKVIGAVLGRETSSAAPVVGLEALSGVYVDHALGCTVEFEPADGGTVVHVLGERLVPEAAADGTFRPTKTSAYYPFRLTDRSREGRPVVEMKLAGAEWVELTPWIEADAADVVLADYIGEYRSDLMGETHHVMAGDDGLEVTLGSPTRQLLWRRLKPRGRDLFSAVIPGEPSDTDVTLVFRRAPDGRVDRFDYNLVRNRGVTFLRRGALS
jgi:CubicO group peptidase (beta-lactamase class C family)